MPNTDHFQVQLMTIKIVSILLQNVTTITTSALSNCWIVYHCSLQRKHKFIFTTCIWIHFFNKYLSLLIDLFSFFQFSSDIIFHWFDIFPFGFFNTYLISNYLIRQETKNLHFYSWKVHTLMHKNVFSEAKKQCSHWKLSIYFTFVMKVFASVDRCTFHIYILQDRCFSSFPVWRQWRIKTIEFVFFFVSFGILQSKVSFFGICHHTC